MTKRNHWVVFFLMACLLSPQLYSQANESDGRFSEVSVAASEMQTKKIRQELRHFKDDDWAGEYYFGDGLGVNVSLTLAPKNGFVFSWHGCLGLYDLNYGDVVFTDGAVKLLFKYPNKQEGFEGIASELLPVRWGKRHYLIAVDSHRRFHERDQCGNRTKFPLRRAVGALSVEGGRKQGSCWSTESPE